MTNSPDKPSDAGVSSGAVAPAATAAHHGAAPRFDFWRAAHGVLRGRYRFAALIAAAGAAVGAGAGVMLGQRIYAASGLVRIASVLPTVLKETDQNKPMAMFDGFIQAQRDLMTSRETIQAAMSDESWKRVSHFRYAPNDEQFASSLRVETRPRSDHLKITFKNRSPAVAAAAVRCVIAAYEQAFIREQHRVEGQRMTQLQERRASLTAEIKKVEDEMGSVAEGRSGSELDPLCAAATERVKKLSGALGDVQCAIAGGPDVALLQGSAPREAAEMVADEILRSLAGDEAHIESQLAEARSHLAPAHPLVVRLTAAAQECRAQVERYAQEMESRRAGSGTGPTPMSLHDREANLRKLTQAAQDDLKRLAGQRDALTNLETQAAALRQNLSETNSRVDALATEASLGSRLTIVSGGDEPMTALLDNRAKYAFVGAMGGLTAPVGLLIAFGLLRRRYRFCDDIAADLTNRVPFVAVVPDLNECPTLAPAAAHCVHDLRVRLQPKDATDRRTYLITSATPGEGKSSIAAALGLSFAAAGFRTLVVDGDLGSRRLTTGFNAGDAPGMIEAAGGAEPQIRRIRTGLSFMPTGQCRPQDACTFSPAAAKRVLTSLRERFDVILVDSDPLATGLGASVLAAQTDGVVVTFSRDQEQPVAQRAVRLIETLGGRLCGAVFNRAPACDFPAAMHRAAQAAASRVLPERLNRFGPLISALLSSISLSREDDLDLMADGINLARSDAAQRNAA